MPLPIGSFCVAPTPLWITHASRAQIVAYHPLSVRYLVLVGADSADTDGNNDNGQVTAFGSRPTGAQMAGVMARMRNQKAGMTTAIFVAALVRLIDLGYQSYSMDELWEIAIVRLPAGEIATAGDGFPPLFHLIFRSLIVTGFGDFAGRVVAAALGIATVWLAGRLGSRLSSRVGVAAAFAVAVAPLLVLLSKEGRAYGLFILLAGVLLMATWDVIGSGSARSWVIYGVVVTLGMYTHYMFALAVASAEIVLLWNLRADHLALRRWIATHAAVVVLLVPLIAVAAADFALETGDDYSPTVGVAAIGYAGLSLFTGFTLGPSTRALHTMDATEAITTALPWIILVGVPAIYLFWHGWKHLGIAWRIRLGIPIVMPLILLTTLSLAVGVAFRVRYLSWISIPLAIWLSAGYLRASGRLRHAAAGILIVLSAAAMITRATIDEYRVEDARAAAEFIAAQPDVPAIAICWYMTRPIEYYLGEPSATFLPIDNDEDRFSYTAQPDNRIVPLPSLRDADPTMVEQNEVFESAVAVGEEYLFVYTRQFHSDPEGEFLALRTATDGVEPVAEYAGITIYRGTRHG